MAVQAHTETQTLRSTEKAALCSHCSSPIPASARSTLYCCTGCEAVATLIKSEGLERYYTMAQAQVLPVGEVSATRTHTWLVPLVERAEASPGLCTMELDVQGIHCAGCVWLMNEVFRRSKAQGAITVNPGLGKVLLRWERGHFSPEAFVKHIESFGYLFGPARKDAAPQNRELTTRLGISAALTINVMLFSVAMYFGLSSNEPELHTLFSRLSLGLSSLTVLIGGWPFFRSAFRGLKTGLLHLDLPIALGIALVYGVTLLQFARDENTQTYLDTLNTFITLMLVGRWLQERVLDRNRRMLLDDDGADGLVVRRIDGDDVQVVPANSVKAGMQLLIAPAELLPVDASLLDDAAQISTDWVSGESKPIHALKNQNLAAGSFNAGRQSFRAVALTDFSDSTLVTLLRQSADAKSAPGALRFWSVLARVWVIAVLIISALGFGLWFSSGINRALEVAVGLLVVTCPCAIGIALPLAYELTLARLRRVGFFARRDEVLDQLLSIRHLVFDKTGTLTLGRLELENAESLSTLNTQQQSVLWNMVIRSNHPVSAAVASTLKTLRAPFSPVAAVEEVSGQGLRFHDGVDEWRLGRAEWASTGGQAAEATVFSRSGVVLAQFSCREVLRADTRRELTALQSDGYETWLLSGDNEKRVRLCAERVGIEPSHARGALLPEQKAEAVRALGAGATLYLGDGVNDALAFSAATVAGTPAIDRPVMPGKSDFFLLGDGLASIRQALQESARLRSVVVRVLSISLTYNVVVVASGLAGLLSPVRAAIFMPLSTLSLLAFTTASLRRESKAQRTPVAPLHTVEVT